MALKWNVGIAWSGDALLMETGDYILLEDSGGGHIWVQDDSAVYTDEKAYAVHPFSLTRGRPNQFSPIQAGKCVLTLDNSTGRFDPWNTSSALSPNVKPRKRVKIVVSENTTDLAVNGGFETAGAGGADVFSSWSETVAAGGAIVNETTYVYKNFHAAKVSYVTGQAYLRHPAVTVTAGKTYTYSFMTSGDGTVGGRYQIYDISNGADILATTATGITDKIYHKIEYEFTAPAGCTSIRFYVYSPTAVGDAYFDSVQLLEWTDHELFHGKIESIKPSGGKGKQKVTVTAYDGWKDFAGYNASIELQESITPDTAIGLLLDSVNWPSGADNRDLDVGDDTLDYWWNNGEVRPAMESLAQSEWGAFWISNEGKATFMNRTAYITGTSVGSLDESQITDIEVSQPWDLIRNEINIKCRPVSVSTATSEFVSNGGMEYGDPTEEWVAGNSTIASYAGSTHSGAAAMSVAATANSGAASQTIEVIPGDSMSFSGWSLRSAAGHQTCFAIRDVTNGAWVYEGGYADNAAWTEDTEPITVPAGCVSLRVDCIVETSGETGYFDDVSLTGVGDTIWSLAESGVSIASGESLTIWGEYYDQYNTPSPAKNVLDPIRYGDYTANSASDGSGADMTPDMSIVTTAYSQAAKMVITNNHGANTLYITSLGIRGKAIIQVPIEIKKEDLGSQDDYGKRVLLLDVPWQQQVAVADSLGDLLVGFYPAPLRSLTLRMEQKLPDILKYDIMDRITFTSETYTVNEVFRLGFMELRTKSNMQGLVARWHFEPCDNEVYFLLGLAGFAELDETARLGA